MHTRSRTSAATNYRITRQRSKGTARRQLSKSSIEIAGGVKRETGSSDHVKPGNAATSVNATHTTQALRSVENTICSRFLNEVSSQHPLPEKCLVTPRKHVTRLHKLMHVNTAPPSLESPPDRLQLEGQSIHKAPSQDRKDYSKNDSDVSITCLSRRFTNLKTLSDSPSSPTVRCKNSAATAHVKTTHSIRLSHAQKKRRNYFSKHLCSSPNMDCVLPSGNLTSTPFPKPSEQVSVEFNNEAILDPATDATFLFDSPPSLSPVKQNPESPTLSVLELDKAMLETSTVLSPRSQDINKKERKVYRPRRHGHRSVKRALCESLSDDGEESEYRPKSPKKRKGYHSDKYDLWASQMSSTLEEAEKFELFVE